MKKTIVILTITFLVLIACTTKKEGNMIVKGQIKGLKKGTLYLQKVRDTMIVTVDSISILGNDTFALADNVDSPEIYYLTFNGNTHDKRLLFFGEKGEISITDKIEEFGFRPQVKGSKNQMVWDNFKKINQKFNDQSLDLIKKEFDSKKGGDKIMQQNFTEERKKITRKRILFATNYAITNSGSEAAPYIALTELYDANIKLLDTINNSLSDNVKSSKYGVKLQNFIDKIKKNEKQNTNP